MEFRKTVLTILPAGQQRRHRHKEQTFGLSREGKSGMIWEKSTETYMLLFVKQITNVSSMNEAEHPKLVPWDNPEG